MARKRLSRATGIGRGNGAGSRVSQFQEGEPSRNPFGRPKKVEQAIPLDLQQALRRELQERVPVTMNNVTCLMPQSEAMAKSMLSDFPNVTFREKLQLFKLLMNVITPDPNAYRQHVPSELLPVPWTPR